MDSQLNDALLSVTLHTNQPVLSTRERFDELADELIAERQSEVLFHTLEATIMSSTIQLRYNLANSSALRMRIQCESLLYLSVPPILIIPVVNAGAN